VTALVKIEIPRFLTLAHSSGNTHAKVRRDFSKAAILRVQGP
jgi:hypothetical protein